MFERPGNCARGIVTGLLDLIYPPHCLVCGVAGDLYLCGKCTESINFIGNEHCRKCGAPGGSSTCPLCAGREFAFQRAACVGIYEGALQNAIHAFKYDGREMLAGPLSELMLRHFDRAAFGGSIDLVLPVPVHWSRLAERGFNQAAKLADRFVRGTGLRTAPGVLVKTRKTRHQADLPQEERYGNVTGVFSVRRPDRVLGQSVLLIDDVFTTGSTLSEAAAVLVDSGARMVFAYTLARSV